MITIGQDVSNHTFQSIESLRQAQTDLDHHSGDICRIRIEVLHQKGFLGAVVDHL